mmetsp:Transcript_4982/g.442  ORF Transcript_4982/g.442 Transcript_4982/m.442 type:complete len:107 (+) Transcript_4982:716-1036(+)
MLDKWEGLGEFVEKHFECSGICDPVPFYYFSDINRGIPTNNVYTNGNANEGTGCITEIKSFIEFYKDLSVILSFSAFGFMFMNVLFSCIICCYSTKKMDPKAYFSY